MFQHQTPHLPNGIGRSRPGGRDDIPVIPRLHLDMKTSQKIRHNRWNCSKIHGKGKTQPLVFVEAIRIRSAYRFNIDGTFAKAFGYPQRNLPRIAGRRKIKQHEMAPLFKKNQAPIPLTSKKRRFEDDARPHRSSC